jgi:hypothetical protein
MHRRDRRRDKGLEIHGERQNGKIKEKRGREGRDRRIGTESWLMRDAKISFYYLREKQESLSETKFVS